MTTKTIAPLAVLSASILLACSGGDDSAPPAAGSQATQGDEAPAQTSKGQASSDQPNAGGPEEAASPVARCSGRYHMTVSHIGDAWLHRNQSRCVVGANELVLHPDGTAAGLNEWTGAEGEWAGDEFHFDVRLRWKGGNYLIKFERLVAEPSK